MYMFFYSKTGGFTHKVFSLSTEYIFTNVSEGITPHKRINGRRLTVFGTMEVLLSLTFGTLSDYDLHCR